MIRFFDILFSLLGLILLFPFFFIIGLFILFDSPGGVFYSQIRVGRHGVDFHLYKFRTMHIDSDRHGLLTVGVHDARITRPGIFLRKYKLDELPQLVNVLKGEMSLVGPRPEMRKYVDLYSEAQKEVLTVRPGITDIASLRYIDENEILGSSSDPEKTYIEEIMPAKLELNLEFIKQPRAGKYFHIIGMTIRKVIG